MSRSAERGKMVMVMSPRQRTLNPQPSTLVRVWFSVNYMMHECHGAERGREWSATLAKVLMCGINFSLFSPCFSCPCGLLPFPPRPHRQNLALISLLCTIFVTKLSCEGWIALLVACERFSNGLQRHGIWHSHNAFWS